MFFDLNGDGRNEVIVASSSEPEIRIVSPPAGKKEAPGVSSDSRLAGSGRSVRDDDDDDEYAWRDGWIPARTVASASLMPSNVRRRGRRAVALAAGSTHASRLMRP